MPPPPIIPPLTRMFPSCPLESSNGQRKHFASLTSHCKKKCASVSRESHLGPNNKVNTKHNEEMDIEMVIETLKKTIYIRPRKKYCSSPVVNKIFFKGRTVGKIFYFI